MWKVLSQGIHVQYESPITSGWNVARLGAQKSVLWHHSPSRRSAVPQDTTSGGRHKLPSLHVTFLDQSYFFIRHINCIRYNNRNHCLYRIAAYMFWIHEVRSSVLALCISQIDLGTHLQYTLIEPLDWLSGGILCLSVCSRKWVCCGLMSHSAIF